MFVSSERLFEVIDVVPEVCDVDVVDEFVVKEQTESESSISVPFVEAAAFAVPGITSSFAGEAAIGTNFFFFSALFFFFFVLPAKIIGTLQPNEHSTTVPVGNVNVGPAFFHEKKMSWSLANMPAESKAGVSLWRTTAVTKVLRL